MTTKPSIVIVGPGAMGCMHAALLTSAGFRVTLLDHRPERAQAISRHGIRLTMADGELRPFTVRCTADPAGLPPADLLIIFTKAYDTTAAIGFAARVIAPQTTVLTLQNGLGNYELLERRVPASRILAGVTLSGATLTGIGEVRVAALGETLLGSPAGNRDRAEEVVALFNAADLLARVTDNVDATLWHKAIINAALNPLGALTRRLNGELLEVPPLRALLGRVAQEAHAVALGLGLSLAEMDPVQTIEQVCERSATNQCSMLQDVLAGRRTEIQQINGEIVRRAQEKGLSAPLNEALVGLVEGL